MNTSIAHLCIGHNRVKMYETNYPSNKERSTKHFLKNNTEYSIELFNPKTTDILIEITIDGKPISMTSRGVILHPGERFYLERFLDTPNKFLYSTYTVEGDNENVEKAIEKNGVIQVKIYDEIIYKSINHLYVPCVSHTQYVPCTQYTLANTTDGFVYNNTTTNIDSLNGQYNNICNISATTTNTFYTDKYFNSEKTTKKIETGRTEKGSHSKQEFGSVCKDNWQITPSEIFTFKIFPISTKVISTKEANRVYCVECGSKIKKGWKFCSNCGTKV